MFKNALKLSQHPLKNSQTIKYQNQSLRPFHDHRGITISCLPYQFLLLHQPRPKPAHPPSLHRPNQDTLDQTPRILPITANITNIHNHRIPLPLIPPLTPQRLRALPRSIKPTSLKLTRLPRLRIHRIIVVRTNERRVNLLAAARVAWSPTQCC